MERSRRRITAGPDGNLWVTEFNASKIGRLTPSGTITEFSVPSTPTAITAGADGSLWFTERYVNRVARIRLGPAPDVAAVYRTTTGEWFIRSPAVDLGRVQFGAPTDRPVPGDYDGDGRADLALYRESTGEWFIRRSTNSHLMTFAWGWPAGGDVAAPGDYDADGTTDIAVYRTSTGEWFIRRSSDGGLTSFGWGSPAHGDIPVAAPYD
jgi:hypothetical protein